MARRAAIGRALIGRDRDPQLQAALASRGIDSLCVKLLDIEPIVVPDLAARLAAAQAVLLTSANAATALQGARRDLSVLAVSDATAEAARGLGFSAVESAQGDLAALAALTRRRIEPAAGPLLYLRGADVAGDMAAALPGYAIDQAIVYRARPVDQLPTEVARELARGAIDLVLLFSPRSAAGFGTLLQRTALAPRCAKMILVAFSPAVARAAETLPWAATHVGAHPSRDGLLAMIDLAIETRDKA